MSFLKEKIESLPELSHKKSSIGLILGFFIKSIGAAWDVSYHFKHFREFYQLPHILNAFGDLIVIFLLVYLWYRGVEKLRPQLKIMLSGVIVFVIGIGVDQWSHEKFGIDLTIWSPSHFILYTGTFISLLGAFLYVIHDYHYTHISEKAKKVFGIIFCYLIFDNFWFTLLQHEQGVVMDYALKHGISNADPDLLDLFFRTQHDVYSNLPTWLYGAWVVLIVVLVFNFIKRMNFYEYGATITSLIYLFMRFILDNTFHMINYPTSVLPYYLIIFAFLFDILYNKLYKQTILRDITTSLVPIVGVIILGSLNIDPPIHPPMALMQTFLFSIPAAIIGYIFGVLLYHLFARK